MKSFIHHLFRDKSVATMLLTASFIIGICALAPSLFVLIVLDKYLASGITSTLISLSVGAIILLVFEFAFRQNRASMIQALNKKIFQPIVDALGKKIKETQTNSCLYIPSTRSHNFIITGITTISNIHFSFCFL